MSERAQGPQQTDHADATVVLPTPGLRRTSAGQAATADQYCVMMDGRWSQHGCSRLSVATGAPA